MCSCAFSHSDKNALSFVWFLLSHICRALCGRTLGHSLRLAAGNSGPLAFAPSVAVRCVSLKVVQPPGTSTLGHDERNMALGREMSPHLTIYKPQLTSMLSITHRFMGEQWTVVERRENTKLTQRIHLQESR